MEMQVIVYEDSGWKRLLPLVYSRGSFELWCGSTSLLARIQRLVIGQLGLSCLSGPPAPLAVWCRSEIATVVAERTGLQVNQQARSAVLLLNGRGVWHKLPARDPHSGSWVGTTGANQTVACLHADANLVARLTNLSILDETEFGQILAGLPRRDVADCVTILDWPWSFVHANGQQLVTDWQDEQAGIAGIVHPGSHLVNAQGIHVGWGGKIKPCVVIDAEDGPVWIGDNVTVYPHSYIHGPVFIGNGSLIQPGSVVQGGTTIGPRSKIGGEVEASIVQGFSNKQHDGFLGHSYIGSWVNLAADCINSDLKNTYGQVRVPINGREVESHEMFVGMFMGDYSKAGINVSFPTGAVIGFCSNVFAPRSPKFVPSFSWLDGESIEPFDEQRGLAVARKVMARRQHVMSAAEERLFLSVREQASALEAN